jgi:hypothetical protein
LEEDKLTTETGQDYDRTVEIEQVQNLLEKIGSNVVSQFIMFIDSKLAFEIFPDIDPWNGMNLTIKRGNSYILGEVSLQKLDYIETQDYKSIIYGLDNDYGYLCVLVL